MLSKTEREYLEGKLKVSKNYENKLLFSIRTKLRCYLDTDLQLLQRGLIRGLPLFGKMTSYQSGLTPPAQTYCQPSKNDFSLTKFGHPSLNNTKYDFVKMTPKRIYLDTKDWIYLRFR